MSDINSRGHAIAALRSAVREGGEALRQRLGEGIAGGARQVVELGAFHCLSDGDAPEEPPFHGIPGHP